MGNDGKKRGTGANGNLDVCSGSFLFAVLLYANMMGVRAVDRIVELCERDIAFIWHKSAIRSTALTPRMFA
ncbi:hypothetical protein GPL15_15680 [Clostridium sp. MCC353]|nr:hypothetical protein [Clostridium sp. MCC353]